MKNNDNINIQMKRKKKRIAKLIKQKLLQKSIEKDLKDYEQNNRYAQQPSTY